mgnify:CR=1 FL=1
MRLYSKNGSPVMNSSQYFNSELISIPEDDNWTPAIDIELVDDEFILSNDMDHIYYYNEYFGEIVYYLAKFVCNDRLKISLDRNYRFVSRIDMILISNQHYKKQLIDNDFQITYTRDAIYLKYIGE